MQKSINRLRTEEIVSSFKFLVVLLAFSAIVMEVCIWADAQHLRTRNLKLETKTFRPFVNTRPSFNV